MNLFACAADGMYGCDSAPEIRVSEAGGQSVIPSQSSRARLEGQEIMDVHDERLDAAREDFVTRMMARRAIEIDEIQAVELAMHDYAFPIPLDPYACSESEILHDAILELLYELPSEEEAA